MGACGTKKKHHSKSVDSLDISRCYYFSRQRDILFEISSKGISKYVFKHRLRCNPDSCVGTIGDHLIMIAGGTDPCGLMTKRVLLINAFNKVVSELAPLPRAAREGSLLKSKGYYYYIGGTVQAEDPFAPTYEEGCPIMRYHIKKEHWEVFTHTSDEEVCSYLGLNRNLAEGEEEYNQEELVYSGFSLKNLISAGAFLYKGRIYLVGGRIFQGRFYGASDRIFSFQTGSKSFDMREEKLRLPIKLVNPVCISAGAHTYITGGYFENDLPNRSMFEIHFEKNQVHECFAKIDSPLEENYPAAYLRESVVIFSFPMLWVKPKNEDVLVSFAFHRKNHRSDMKETDMIEGKEWKSASERNANLSSGIRNGKGNMRDLKEKDLIDDLDIDKSDDDEDSVMSEVGKKIERNRRPSKRETVAPMSDAEDDLEDQ